MDDNTSNYLLVYGTLLTAGNTYAHFLLSNSQCVGNGRFPGLLYDIGEYPGAVYIPDAAGNVYGQVRLLTNTDKVLPILDEYEGFGPDEEQPNLFVRELIEVETSGGKLLCWVYLFNRPVKQYRLITSGKYK